MWCARDLIIFLCVLNSANGINLILPRTSNDSDVNNVYTCILKIVEKNKIFRPTYLINDNKQTQSYASIENKLLEMFFRNNIPTISLSKDNYVNETIDNCGGNLVSIIYICTCQSFIDFSDVAIDKDNKYMIILHEDVMSNCRKKVLETARKVALYDVTFIYKDNKEDIFKVSTCIPAIDPETCKLNKNIGFTDVGTCRNGLIDQKNVNIFPKKKPSDWMSCPLSVGMGSLYPFVKTSIENMTNMDPLNVVSGSDVELLKIIADYFNASLNFYHIDAVAENIFLDLSFLPFILNGTLEICAGGLFRVFDDLVAYSGVYSREEIVWIYTVERPSGSWVTFLDKIDGLFIFIFFYLFYAIIWNIFSLFDEHKVTSNIFIYAWGALTGGSGLPEAKTTKEKILSLFYLVLCLHLSAYISTQLYSFLTIQGPPYVYRNTDDISKSGIPLYLKDKAKYFVEDEHYVRLANTSRNCVNFQDCVAKTLINKGSTVIVDGMLPIFQSETAVKGEARVLKAKEAILVVYHEMIIWKESYLVGTFDKVITTLAETGISEKVYKEAIGILVIDKAQDATRNMMSQSYRCMTGCKITLSQCAGGFYVWIIGCIVSICIFCGEILVHKNRK